jgi:hypothetical protein
VRRQKRQGGRDPLVEKMGALAAAEDEHGQPGRPRLRRQGVEILPDRVPEQDPFSLEKGQGRGERDDGLAGPADEQAVGESRPGVLFQDERRDPEPGGQQDQRAGAVAADADDQARLRPDQQSQRLDEGQRQQEQSPQGLEAPALEAFDPHRNEPDPVLLHDPLLDVAVGAGVGQAQRGIALEELAAHDQGRVEVAARPAAADDHVAPSHILTLVSPSLLFRLI